MAGAHRFVWDFHETSPDGPLVPPGTYTVRLSVNGASFDLTAAVLRDPRVPADDADLRAQYELAKQVVALRSKVASSRSRAQQLAKTALSPDRAQTLRTQIIGQTLPENPDDSVGAYSQDFTSLLYLENQLDYLESAVESADAAPTPEMRRAYDVYEALYRKTLARLDAIAAK
jgi:hypothetical protein